MAHSSLAVWKLILFFSLLNLVFSRLSRAFAWSIASFIIYGHILWSAWRVWHGLRSRDGLVSFSSKNNAWGRRTGVDGCLLFVHESVRDRLGFINHCNVY